MEQEKSTDRHVLYLLTNNVCKYKLSNTGDKYYDIVDVTCNGYEELEWVEEEEDAFLIDSVTPHTSVTKLIIWEVSVSNEKLLNKVYRRLIEMPTINRQILTKYGVFILTTVHTFNSHKGAGLCQLDTDGTKQHIRKLTLINQLTN